MTDEEREAELNRQAEDDAYADARTGAQGPHPEAANEFVRAFTIAVCVFGGIAVLAAIILVSV